MRFTVKLNGVQHSWDRPTDKEERRNLALDIKRLLFPGKDYRIHKARGAAALAAA